MDANVQIFRPDDRDMKKRTFSEAALLVSSGLAFAGATFTSIVFFYAELPAWNWMIPALMCLTFGISFVTYQKERKGRKEE